MREEGKEWQTACAVKPKPPAGSPWWRRSSRGEGRHPRKRGGAAGEEVEVGDKDMKPETEL